MTNTEHTSKTPSSATGIFALLGALLRVKGTGAPKISRGGGASKKGRRLILPALAATLAALAFTTAPALATPAHEFKESFNGGVGHELSDPTGVAVNNATGNVYIVDKGNNRVEEFNPTGAMVIAEFSGKGTAGELSEPETIAIDNSGKTGSEDPSVGDVYVTDHNVVDKFSSTGEYKGQITGTCATAGEVPPSCGKSTFVEFEPLEGVAVDPEGQLWVSQANAQIDAFSDADPNVFLSSRATELEELNPGLAVDSEDRLYVPHGEPGFLAQLNSMGELLKNPAGGERDRGRTGVAVEPVSNDVYIDKGNPEHGTPKIQVYTPGGFTADSNNSLIETFGEAQLTDGGGTGLAVSYANVSSGDVYVVDSSANKVDIFVPTKAMGYFESFSFGGEGAGSGKFTEPLGIAMDDETKDLYVVDKGNKRVEEFNSTGTKVEAEFAPPGGFNEPEDIAVDNCKNVLGEPCSAITEDPSVGDVYVSDQLPHETGEHSGAPVYEVDKFSDTGTYLGQLRRCPEEERFDGDFGCEAVGYPTAGFDVGVSGVAVGPEGDVWVGNSHEFGEEPYEFSNTEPNIFLESSKSPASGSSALDPATGELFVDKGSSIDRYASESSYASKSSPLEMFPSAGGLQESQGIAVSPAGTVYATERTADNVKAFKEFPLAQVAVGAVSNLRPTSVTLEGSVNPEGEKVSSCEFEYGTTTSYGQVVPCEQGLGKATGEIGEGKEPVLVSAKLSGLPSGTTYHYRLVASDAIGTNPSSDHLFTTPGPSVTAEQVTYVEATVATLNAQIDPDGGATSYHFEYDTRPYGEGEAAHGTSLPVPSASIGAGTSPVSVSVELQGLEADETYYYRAVGEGEPLGAPESFYGTGKTFTTNSAKGSEPPQNCPNEQRRVEQPYGPKLPDCRAYEMVSPLETLGNDATDSFLGTGHVRAAAEDAAITYRSAGSFAEPDGATHVSQFLSRRNEQAGRWETRSIVAPLEHDTGGEEPVSYEGVFFTPELTEGLTTTAADLTTAPEAAPTGLQELYLADLASSPQSYRLVSHLPPSEEEYAHPYEAIPSVYSLGASSDLTHVVFATEKGAPGTIGPLREWVAGRVVFVGVSNEGEVWTGAEVGNNPGVEHNVGLMAGYANVWRAVSEDGSRVIFNYSGELYARVNVGVKAEPEPEREQSKLNAQEECTEPAKACTVKLSAGAARYVGASADDSKIFYIENERLYEYTLEPGHVTGHVIPLASGDRVQGVTQISEDGSYVYFVADGALALHATPQTCTGSGAGEGCNLYVYHQGGAEPVKFIATLSSGDGSDWEVFEPVFSKWDGGPGSDSAVLAPGKAGGAHLAFTSSQSLTGYDNRDAVSGALDSEVFLYDAETGALACASCDPSGARPLGSASLATGSYDGGGASNYRPRDLLADGELFFDSSDALVPHAGDGRQNVYEFENGHIYAISNVSGGQESSFLDATADGQDVFFASADKLLPEDTGNNVAVWDAREDGGFPVKVSAPAVHNRGSLPRRLPAHTRRIRPPTERNLLRPRKYSPAATARLS